MLALMRVIMDLAVSFYGATFYSSVVKMNLVFSSPFKMFFLSYVLSNVVALSSGAMLVP